MYGAQYTLTTVVVVILQVSHGYPLANGSKEISGDS